MKLPAPPKFPILGVQVRILATFLLVVAAVQFGGLALIDRFGAASVRQAAGADAVAGGRVFERVLELDTQRLIEGARQLTADPAFREMALAGDHRNALTPALARHAKRVNAAMLLVADAHQQVTAGTLDAEIGRRFAYAKLLDRAALAQQATGVAPVGGQLYRLAVVPLRPAQATGAVVAGWVIAGFRIDNALASEYQTLTGLQVTLLDRRDAGEWRIGASTLAEPERTELARDVNAGRYASSGSDGNAEFAGAAITRVLNLAPGADDGALAVLQLPLAQAFQPFRDLELQLAWIALVGVLAAIAAGFLLGRGIARPVRELTGAARRIAAGDYAPGATIARNDEIGELGKAFAAMRESVAATVSRLTDRAHRDALTGLPTRALFNDRLELAIAAGARAGSPVAVMICKLDGFGHVNDTLGHAIGELLLREVATRLRSAMRRATDTVAHVGGDEFAIIMPGCRASEAQRVAEAVRRALQVRMTLDGHIVDVQASLGIAVCPEHGTDPAKLFACANTAMRAAMRDKLGVALWDERYDEHGGKRLALLADLRKAVDNDELALTYQPKVMLGECGEHFVEALVRWQHPERGLVSPTEFVPLAEQTGYIRTITRWVLERAVVQCADWRSRGLALNVSVNISERDLVDGELAKWLQQVLEEKGCAARWLTLEVTESAIIGDPGHALNNLERLHELGCKLAIDDYGTGYSSLAFVRRLPLNELKIDKSCIMGMADDESDALIVRSTIEVAHQLGLAVIAGGVENEATLEQLRALGCDGVQGFLLSRPLPADDVPPWIKESNWARPAREKGSLRRVR